MMDGPIPAEFDWVRALHKCSIQHVFKELEIGVKADVDARQSLFPANAPIRLSVATGPRRFSVVRAVQDNPLSESVDFILGNGEIVARNDEETFSLTAILTLNSKGECRLLVEGDELEQWQFRRMALERMFFAPRSS